MKRIISLICAVLLLLPVLSGCASVETEDPYNMVNTAFLGSLSEMFGVSPNTLFDSAVSVLGSDVLTFDTQYKYEGDENYSATNFRLSDGKCVFDLIIATDKLTVYLDNDGNFAVSGESTFGNGNYYGVNFKKSTAKDLNAKYGYDLSIIEKLLSEKIENRKFYNEFKSIFESNVTGVEKSNYSLTKGDENAYIVSLSLDENEVKKLLDIGKSIKSSTAYSIFNIFSPLGLLPDLFPNTDDIGLSDGAKCDCKFAVSSDGKKLYAADFSFGGDEEKSVHIDFGVSPKGENDFCFFYNHGGESEKLLTVFSNPGSADKEFRFVLKRIGGNVKDGYSYLTINSEIDFVYHSEDDYVATDYSLKYNAVDNSFNMNVERVEENNNASAKTRIGSSGEEIKTPRIVDISDIEDENILKELLPILFYISDSFDVNGGIDFIIGG